MLLKRDLKEGDVYKVLNELNPLSVQSLIDSKTISELNDEQIVQVLSFSVKSKFIKIIEGTEGFKLLEQIILKRLGSLKSS